MLFTVVVTIMVVKPNLSMKKKDSVMPIYEFKCLECEEFFEILVMGADRDKEIKCPKCSAFDVERVVSRSNFAMAGPSSAATQGAGTQTRNCSSGSCTTYNIPGESRG